MLEGLEIVRITRIGHDYALHFSDGTLGLFDAKDIEPMLICVGAPVPLESPRKTYLN